ncbi:efflux RND transporter periplasmic adaptor subunit [Halomonas alkalisoli]|uniref:efflux RND transporter periplasmic adaptor subunit n=1 Tax=Halomonas alkalisoli TaxID=2907158 RepID=UPI001F2CBB9B|nr:HlyD family efflux transporter periplasmic adaptor subunit [Halomonas alkalisoli]MCE9680861.1 HlyD family efflux transporter periplasmic adaptor subunit [Halomonas alkalisoli]
MIKRLLPVLILAIGVAGFLALRLTRPEPVEAVAQERSWRVESMVVAYGEHVPVLPLFGEVVSPDRVGLVAPMPARVAERRVQEGQRVAAGTLLVALDEADTLPPLRQAEAEVADIEAQIANEQIRHDNDREALARERDIVANAQRQLERTRSLVERNLASPSELDNASDTLARARLTVATREGAIAEHPARLQSLQARLARAEAVEQAARRDAERGRVVAPFDGVVTGIRVAPGDQVASGAALLSLYPLDGLELHARVPQRYLAELGESLEQGEPLMAEAVDDAQRFRLQRLAGESEPGGTEAILVLEGSASGLRPGALQPVLLQRPVVAEALAVPFSALHGSDVLYRIDEENRLQRHTVVRLGETLGIDGERWALVKPVGLSAGDRIIVTHLPNAMQGLRVDVAQHDGMADESPGTVPPPAEPQP